MGKGAVSRATYVTHHVPLTGLSVRRLAHGTGDCHHLYFTNSGWHDGGRRLVFVSNHDGATDLFSLDLTTGSILQLTDERRQTADLMFTSLNPVRPEAYFWRSGDLVALDLDSLRERVIHRTPQGFSNNLTSVTAHGAHVCTVIYEDLRHRFDVDLLNGHVGFEAYWAARPVSSILQIDAVTGVARTLLTEQAWIGHVNASPRLPHLLSYCHEGPWDKVDQRIWGLDSLTGRSWKIRPARAGETVGHEYWLADGVSLGFHGAAADGGHYFGAVGSDNRNECRCALPIRMMHAHSNGLDFIVGDGNRRQRLLYFWNASGRGAHAPIPILGHGCSARTQARHVHPRLSPDSRSVLFVSDKEGQGQIYMVEVDEVLEKCRPAHGALAGRAAGGRPPARRDNAAVRPAAQGEGGVHFVDLPGNPGIGSSLLRSYQLHRLASPHLAAAGLPSAVVRTLATRNALLVLNKASLLRLGPDDIRAARARGNIVAADPLDGMAADGVLAACSILIASSLMQFEAFRRQYPATPSIHVAHHVDLRIPTIVPPADRLKLAYFGEIANAAFADRLSALVAFHATDTRRAQDVAWMTHLAAANAHYALRSRRPHDGLKPFTKGFVAAHCSSPVLADIRDEEAVLHLTPDYPYLADGRTITGVASAVDRMRAGFGGAEWQRACAIMQRVKLASDPQAVARRFVADLLALEDVARIRVSG